MEQNDLSNTSLSSPYIIIIKESKFLVGWNIGRLIYLLGLTIRNRIWNPPNFWSILESESGIRFNSEFGFLIGRLKLASRDFSFNSTFLNAKIIIIIYKKN